MMKVPVANRIAPEEGAAVAEEEEGKDEPLRDPWLDALGVKATSEASRRTKGKNKSKVG